MSMPEMVQFHSVAVVYAKVLYAGLYSERIKVSETGGFCTQNVTAGKDVPNVQVQITRCLICTLATGDSGFVNVCIDFCKQVVDP